MNYVVYYHNPNDDEPAFEGYGTLELARSNAQIRAKNMPEVEVFVAQKISTFTAEVTIKET